MARIGPKPAEDGTTARETSLVPPVGAPASAVRAFRRACLYTLGLLLAGALGALLISPNHHYADSLVFLTLFCALRQDIPVAVGLMLFMGVFASRIGARLLDQPVAPLAPRGNARLMIGLIVATALAAWLIRLWVLMDHDLSRDEQMATFDAAIFSAGRLFWPLPPEMRPFYVPLNNLFLLPLGAQEGLISSYLPVNSAIRALAGLVLPAALISPVLLLIAGLALWRIAQRIWPRDRGTEAVVILCFAGSSQALLTAASTFAMTAHLALNLVWLALFLRRTRWGTAGAVVIGFLATGLHQPLFHPLFVLPFLDLLRRQRRWRELAIYCGCYGLIGLFWLFWPQWVAGHAGPVAGAAPDDISFFGRLVRVVAVPNFDAVWLMAGNALRFVTWQHALLVPLLLVAVRKVAGRDDLARALALGTVLVFLVMFILLPPQGHGWGYRYAHGLIGSCCLLAGYGWRWLRENGGAPVRAMQLATVLSMVLLLPLHAMMVRSFVVPFAQGAAAFAKVDADYLVVENNLLPFGTNLVINRPDLSNRPRLLLGNDLRPALLGRLCPGHSIAFASAAQFNDIRVFYIERPVRGISRHQAALIDAATAGGCRIVPFVRH